MVTLPTTAIAHVVLVKSNPAQGAAVQKPVKIELVFNEKIVGSTAISKIVMTGMPGMANHQPMMMRDFSAQMSKDGKSMTLLLKRPLPTGTYDVKWDVTGLDKDKVQGVISFSVK